MTSIIQKCSIVHDPQFIMRYMQAPFQYLSIATRTRSSNLAILILPYLSPQPSPRLVIDDNNMLRSPNLSLITYASLDSLRNSHTCWISLLVPCFYKRNEIVRDWLRWCSFARRVGELSPRSARIFCRRSKDAGPEALCERESAYLRTPL